MTLECCDYVLCTYSILCPTLVAVTTTNNNNENIAKERKEHNEVNVNEIVDEIDAAETLTSSFILPMKNPTLQDLRYYFPFEGFFHFRLLYKDLLQNNQIYYKDLINENEVLVPTTSNAEENMNIMKKKIKNEYNRIYIKALYLHDNEEQKQEEMKTIIEEEIENNEMNQIYENIAKAIQKKGTKKNIKEKIMKETSKLWNKIIIT